MVFMHVYGHFYPIEIDQEDGTFYYLSGDKRVKLYNIKTHYDRWFYEVFESKVLGSSDD